MWRSQIQLLRYRATKTTKYPVHAIVASFMVDLEKMLPHLMYDGEWVDKKEALDFLKVLANTHEGMYPDYQYRLRVLDDDAKLTDPDEGDEEEVRSGERDAVLYLEYWGGGKGLNSVCKVTLNNKKSSWNILLCNYAVMTRQTERKN